ncbi:hypothetical protein SDC9_180349 [bioreactor metagenome]|uniref:Uncharacterized protein n=1 Tax=bioreactor metagenome TaxID=1076179 RepID=A0A645H300_9ZZZZ
MGREPDPLADEGPPRSLQLSGLGRHDRGKGERAAEGAGRGAEIRHEGRGRSSRPGRAADSGKPGGTPVPDRFLEESGEGERRTPRALRLRSAERAALPFPEARRSGLAGAGRAGDPGDPRN